MKGRLIGVGALIILVALCVAITNGQIPLERRIANAAVGGGIWCGKPWNSTLDSDGFQEDIPTFSAISGKIPYTDEKQGDLLLSSNRTVWGQTLSLKVVVNETGQILLDTSFIAAKRSRFSFPLSKFANGHSILLCSIYNGTTPVETLNVSIWVLPPKSNVVKVDNLGGGLVVDGLPFFPNGLYAYYSTSPPMAQRLSTETMSGMNMVLPYYNGIPDSLYMAFMDACRDMEIKVLHDLSKIGPLPPSKNKTDSITKTVTMLKDHPALLGYYIADEPDGLNYGVDPTILYDVYTLIKKLDPYHPVTLVLNCAYSAPRYISTTDILMTDPYPIALQHAVGCDYCQGKVTDVPHRVSLVLEETLYTKPLWLVPQAFGGEGHWLREPTAKEYRVMTYAAIIRGSKGNVYFVAFPYSLNLWGECRVISLQIAELQPWILSSTEGPKVVSNTPSVEAASFLYNGYAVVLVVNTENEPQILHLQVENFSGNATVLFEQQREVHVTNGELIDIIDGFGTRAYMFRVDADESTLKSDAVITATNLAQNPSFETQSNVGIPDAYNFFLSSNGSSALTDSRVAKEGLHSLRLTENIASNQITMYSYQMAMSAGVTYDVSIWTKGSSDGLTIELLGSNCAVSTQWKQCYATFTPSSDARYTIKIVLNKGTVWLDVLQVIPRN